jgi:hypothetical protein
MYGSSACFSSLSALGSCCGATVTQAEPQVLLVSRNELFSDLNGDESICRGYMLNVLI